MKFTKMQGIGNDYVYINGFHEAVADPAALAVKIADRHFGVGGDGLIMILPSDKADVRMRMFNADGSEAEMCGNGVRCVAKYAYDHGLTRSNPMRVETGRGVLTLQLELTNGKVDQVTVNMGEPILEASRIPIQLAGVTPQSRVIDADLTGLIDWPNVAMPTGDIGRYISTIRGERWLKVTGVSMGNPHAVTFLPGKVAVFPLDVLGPVVETLDVFPRRVNFHIVEVNTPSEVTMRTWERGSGITLACGTGACAVCVAGVLTGKTERSLLAHLPGGDLRLEWRESDNHVYMTGPATEVFSGVWNG
jgi:diaminopimelate epimerase